MKRFLTGLTVLLFLIPLGCDNRVTEPEASPQASPPPPSFRGNTGAVVYTEFSGIPVAQADLYYLDLTTNKREKLTTNSGPDQMADWAPGGDWIVFGSAVPPSMDLDLYVMEVAGDGTPGVPIALFPTGHPGWDTYPAWSPDGTKIAFRCNRGDICYVSLTGLANGNPVASTPDTLTVVGDLYFDTRPSWSPDSQEIIFSRNCRRCPEPEDNQRDLWKVDLDGVETRVTNTPGINEDNPSWNPSPPPGVQEVAYNVISDVGGEGEANYIFINTLPELLPITETGTQLTTDGLEDYPWFAPTGDQIFYLTEYPSGIDVFMMSSDGTKQKNVTRTPNVNEGFAVLRPVPGVKKY